MGADHTDSVSRQSKAAVSNGGFVLPVSKFKRERKGQQVENPSAYNVIVTTDWNINLIITNRRKDQLRSYSHFITQEQANQFANTLESVVTPGRYIELDTCPFCGKHFFRHEKLCDLWDSRTLHQKCVDTAVRCGVLTYQDCKGDTYSCFPKDIPLFDFSNLTSESRSMDFRYAIQTVSKRVIHLFLIEPRGRITRRTCLTYEECLGLVQMIRERLKQLNDASLGTCTFCGRMAYIDKTNYLLASGEFIHGSCMERFVQSPMSANVSFPVVRIPPTDVFGHRQMFGKKFDPMPFLEHPP